MSDERSSWPVPSRRRRLLAVYLDFLLLGAPIHLALWALRQTMPWIDAGSVPLRLGWFAVIEWLLVARFKWSPGNYALGIVLRPLAPLEGAIEPSAERKEPRVDPDLLARERWWTMLAGVLFVLEAAKLMVRWTEWSRPMPFLGMALGHGPSAGLQLALGVAQAAAGVGVLRLRQQAAAAGFALALFVTASMLASGSLLPDWIAHDVVARRAVQGLPVRDGEIETMQALVPPTMVAVSTIEMVWMMLVWMRARDPGAG